MRQGFSGDFAFVSPTIERNEGILITKLENHFYSRHPVGAFTMNQMTDNFEDVPGVFAFVLGRPLLGEVPE